MIPDEFGISAVERFGRKLAGIVIVDKKENANHQEKRELEEDNEPTREQRKAAFAEIAGGQEPLNKELFGAMAGRGEEAAADHSSPKRILGLEELLREREMEIEELKFVGGVAQGDGMRPAAGDQMQDQEEADQRAADIEKHLDNVGPNHGRHAAFKRVEERQANDNGNGDNFDVGSGKEPSNVLPRTTEMTRDTANTRTPSASARRIRKMPAVNLRICGPKRRPINS